VTYPALFELYTPEGKGIVAELDAQGVVRFAIEAGPCSAMRGTEMFNRMIDHFGSAMKAIHGIWVKSSQGRPSTNIDKVNELTGQGMSCTEAIAQTWTVTRAAKRGFCRTSLLGQPTGRPGRYTQIEVLIER